MEPDKPYNEMTQKERSEYFTKVIQGTLQKIPEKDRKMALSQGYSLRINNLEL